jgi:tellurite resistance protein
MDFFPEVKLDRTAAEAMARALYAVAKVDGVHSREAALIGAFWMEVGGGAEALAELERAATPTAIDLASLLRTETERLLFFKTALLLAWVDGRVSDAERSALNVYAEALELTDDQTRALEAGVKEFLLSHLSGLANTTAVVEVARKLEV